MSKSANDEVSVDFEIKKEPQETSGLETNREPVPIKLIRNQAAKSAKRVTRLNPYDKCFIQDTNTTKVVKKEDGLHDTSVEHRDSSLEMSSGMVFNTPDFSSKTEGTDKMSGVRGVGGSNGSSIQKSTRVPGIPMDRHLLPKAKSSAKISPNEPIDLMNLCKGKSESDISKLISSGQNQVIVLKSSKPLDQATLVKASLQAIRKSSVSPSTQSMEVTMEPHIKNTPVYNVLKDGQQAIKLTDSVSELEQTGGVKPSFLFEDKHGKLMQPSLSKQITVKIQRPDIQLPEKDTIVETRRHSPHKLVDVDQPFTPFIVGENKRLKQYSHKRTSSDSIVAQHSILSAALKKPLSSSVPKLGPTDSLERKGPDIMSRSLSDIEPNGNDKHFSREDDFQTFAKPVFDEKVHTELRMKEQTHSATKAKLKEQIQSSEKVKLKNVQSPATKKNGKTKSALTSARSLLHPPTEINSTKSQNCDVQKESLQTMDTVDSNMKEKAKCRDDFEITDATSLKDSKDVETSTKTNAMTSLEEDVKTVRKVTEEKLENVTESSSEKSESKCAQTEEIPSKKIKKTAVLEDLKSNLLKFCTAHIEEQEKLNCNDLRKEKFTFKFRVGHEEDDLSSSTWGSNSNEAIKESLGLDPHKPDVEAISTKVSFHGAEEYVDRLSSYINRFTSNNKAVREVDNTDIEKTVILTTKIKKRPQIYPSIIEPEISQACRCTVTKNVVPDEQTYYMDGFLKYLPNIGILLCGEYEVTGLKLNDDWYLCIPEIINKMPGSLSTNLHRYVQLDNAITKPMPNTFRWYMRKRQGIPVTSGNLMLSLKSFQKFLSRGIKQSRNDEKDTQNFESSLLYQSGITYKRLLGHNLRCLSCKGLISTGENTKYFTDIDVDDLMEGPSQISKDSKNDTEQEVESEEKSDRKNERKKVKNSTNYARNSQNAHPRVAMKIGMVDIKGELFHSFRIHKKNFLSLNQLYVRNVIVIDIVLTRLAKMKVSPRRPPSEIEKFLQEIHSSFINTAWISMNSLQYVCLQGGMKILNWRKDLFDAICDGQYNRNFMNTIYAEDDTEYDTLYLNPLSGRIIKWYRGSLVVPGNPQAPEFPAKTRQLLRDVQIGVHHGVVKLADYSSAMLLDESRLKKKEAEDNEKNLESRLKKRQAEDSEKNFESHLKKRQAEDSEKNFESHLKKRQAEDNEKNFDSRLKKRQAEDNEKNFESRLKKRQAENNEKFESCLKKRQAEDNEKNFESRLKKRQAENNEKNFESRLKKRQAEDNEKKFESRLKKTQAEDNEKNFESRLKKREAEDNEKDVTSSKRQHKFKPLSEIVPLRYTYQKKRKEKYCRSNRNVAVTQKTLNKSDTEEDSFAERKGRKRKCTQMHKCYKDEEEDDGSRSDEMNDITENNESKNARIIVSSTPSEETTVEFIIKTECVGENKVLFGMRSAGNDSYNENNTDYTITKKVKKQVLARKISKNDSAVSSSDEEESEKEDESVSPAEPSEHTYVEYSPIRVKDEPFDPSWENIDSENMASIVSDGRGSMYVVNRDESLEEKFVEPLVSEKNDEQETGTDLVAVENIKVEADDYF